MSETKYEQVERVTKGLRNHTPTQEGIERIKAIREVAQEFAETVIHTTNTGRDQSLALTAIEDATMRAVRAIALEGDPSDPS